MSECCLVVSHSILPAKGLLKEIIWLVAYHKQAIGVVSFP